IKEAELCQRYIDPNLSALFDDPEHNILFRWTSTTNQEFKDSFAKGSITSQRPDSCISELNGLYFGSSLGYVEVKPAAEENNKYLVSKDLVRLGTLTKNSIDISGLKSCMGIQVVNHIITFFMNELKADGMYFLTEIGTVKTPSCIEDLGTFIHYFDELAAILKCYEKNYVLLSSDQIGAFYMKRRSTIPDEEFYALSPSKSNKRKSVSMPPPPN
ncbi:hypothetical protein BDC45DRAFT_441598, partial [Circinella umbellata]